MLALDPDRVPGVLQGMLDKVAALPTDRSSAGLAATCMVLQAWQLKPQEAAAVATRLAAVVAAASAGIEAQQVRPRWAG